MNFRPVGHFSMDLMADAQKLLLGVLGSIFSFCQDLWLMKSYFLHYLASAKLCFLGVVFMI